MQTQTILINFLYYDIKSSIYLTLGMDFSAMHNFHLKAWILSLSINSQLFSLKWRVHFISFFRKCCQIPKSRWPQLSFSQVKIVKKVASSAHNSNDNFSAFPQDNHHVSMWQKHFLCASHLVTQMKKVCTQGSRLIKSIFLPLYQKF